MCKSKRKQEDAEKNPSYSLQRLRRSFRLNSSERGFRRGRARRIKIGRTLSDLTSRRPYRERLSWSVLSGRRSAFSLYFYSVRSPAGNLRERSSEPREKSSRKENATEGGKLDACHR